MIPTFDAFVVTVNIAQMRVMFGNASTRAEVKRSTKLSNADRVRSDHTNFVDMSCFNISVRGVEQSEK